MTDTETPTPDPTPEPLPPAAEADPEPSPGPNREAAKYRRERNELRAERDALRATLDDRHRQDVERLAAERLADPGDLWLATTLDAMRGEDGMIDTGKAEAAIERVVSEKPHWAKPPTRFPNLPQGARESAEPPPGFGQTIKKALGGG